jgi:hypothetical protein
MKPKNQIAATSLMALAASLTHDEREPRAPRMRQPKRAKPHKRKRRLIAKESKRRNRR